MASRSADEVQKAWAAYRPQILSRHFAKAAGTYRLVITLNPPQEDTADADEKQGERIEVGLVQLQAVGTEIALSVEGVELSASPEALAIRIAKPASLKALESAALDAVPLDQMTQPLDLSPTDGGAWAGEADMRGGQRVRVALEPVE